LIFINLLVRVIYLIINSIRCIIITQKRKLKEAVQKTLKEGQPLDLNYTYVIFGKNNVYKDKFPLIFRELNDVFKRIKQMDK